MKVPGALRRVEQARRRLPENVRRLGWISFANDAASELAYPIVPLFLTITLGAPVAAVGAIEGVAEGLATGVRLLSGWVSDRTGNRRKPWILGGYGASTVARAGLAAAPAWGWVLGARVVDRLGKGARGTPRDALIRDSTPPELRGSSFGYHRALDTAGAIVGPLLAVVLLESGLSLRGILWVACVLGAGVLVLLRGVREAPGHADPAPSAAQPARVPLPRAFWAALAVWFVFSLGNSSDAFLVLRARDLGLGAVVVVLAYAVYNVIYASLAWPFGTISDRVPRALVLGAGLGVFTLVYLGFALASRSWTVWPLFAVYGVYIAATEGVARAWVADTLPDRSAVGTAFGIFFTATAAAALVASVVAGVLWTYVSPRAPFVVGAAAGLAALLLLVAFEAGWEARAGSIKAALVGIALVVVAAAAAGVAIDHRRIADAFDKREAEALPAGFVRPCGPEPTARAAVGFPAAGSTFTESRKAGPTTIVAGFRPGDITEANRAFRAALPPAGYTVVRSEVDPADSEVVFAGASTTGEVAITQECRSRVRLRITLRPR
ncbi:MAG TPA: MFS transporter [Gaiellaceae bacterium]|jgi:MFS family permease|nr:MFS transporter [Gaiellaceae bacterium]